MEPEQQQIFCPNCGAPVPFRGTMVSAVCEYCSSTVVRTGVDVELLGQVSAVVDTGSPILLYSRGNFAGQPFVVDGRLQVRYLRGTWNEWLLGFQDGGIGWLSDAQGNYAVMRPSDAAAIADRVPSFDEIYAGQTLVVLGRELVVVDRRAARYQGAEGQLPFRAEPGLLFHAVDLRGYEGEFVTLDWGNEADHRRPLVYSGRSVSLDEIALTPMRRFEGWPPPRPAAAGTPS